MPQAVRQGVTILDRETLNGLQETQRNDLMDRVRKSHPAPMATLLIRLMSEYSYKDAQKVLDLAEKQVRGLRARTPSGISQDDVNDIVKHWYARIGTNKDFPRSISLFTESQAEDFRSRLRKIRGPTIRYA